MPGGHRPNDGPLPHRLTLCLLGGYVLVRCRYAECRDGIADYFSCAVVERPWRTPDVIVDCTWSAAGRYLFRARPQDHPDPRLQGVRVHVKGVVAAEDWTSRQAPLPPLSVDPFVDRFVALHAGAVTTPDGGALALVGDKGAGKTTTTVDLVNNHRCALITDEATFLHRRTRLVEPFPRSVGVAEHYDRATGQLMKRPRPADEVCANVEQQPVRLDRVAFLQPSSDVSGVSVEPVSASTALRLLLANQFDVSATADEGLVTLMHLAKSTDTLIVRYGTYEDLCKVGALLLSSGNLRA